MNYDLLKRILSSCGNLIVVGNLSICISYDLHNMHVCFIDLLANVLEEVSNAQDLKFIAEKLRREFDELVVKVESTLKTKNISVHDVKRFINRKLHSIRIKEEQLMEPYRQKLHGIQDMDSLFDDFLLKYYFISYLNYVLLKDIGKLANITSLFKEYEKSYVRLISTAKFRDIMSVFDQNSDLRPTGPIGLPTIVFRLDDLWQDKTMFDFIRAYLWGFSRYESILLDKLKENCVVITYSVFPSILSDVLEYFKSSAVQQMLQEMGVSVELPEDLGRNKG